MKKVIIIAMMAVVLASCTDNQMAKNYGGTMSIDLPKGQKLVNATWKGESDLWYLTRTMLTTDSAETYTFHQEKGSAISMYGNGQVIFKESK